MLNEQKTVASSGFVNVLKSQSAKEKCGTLWLNVNPDRISALTHSLLFFARRYLIAIIIVFLSSSFLQLSLLWISSLLLLFVNINVKPMSSPTHNYILVINETIVYISICIMFLFTGYVEAASSRWIFGYVFISLAYLCIGLNLTIIIRVAIQWFNLYLKIRSARKWQTKWKKEVESNPEL